MERRKDTETPRGKATANFVPWQRERTVLSNSSIQYAPSLPRHRRASWVKVFDSVIRLLGQESSVRTKRDKSTFPRSLVFLWKPRKNNFSPPKQSVVSPTAQIYPALSSKHLSPRVVSHLHIECQLSVLRVCVCICVSCAITFVTLCPSDITGLTKSVFLFILFNLTWKVALHSTWTQLMRDFGEPFVRGKSKLKLSSQLSVRVKIVWKVLALFPLSLFGKNGQKRQV